MRELYIVNKNYSSAQQYLQRLLALPAMQDWYQQALAEPWLDEAHDEEVARHGQITADLRQHSG